MRVILCTGESEIECDLEIIPRKGELVYHVHKTYRVERVLFVMNSQGYCNMVRILLMPDIGQF